MKPFARSALQARVWPALVLLPLAIYWQVRGYEFVNFDDVDYVYGNARVLSGLGMDGLRWAFTTFHAGNWHPLVWLSLMLDAQFWGSWAGGYHLTNVAFHVANGLLLFVLLQRATGAWWRSAVVAALFAVHPLHVESVAWVAARKDLLSTLFGLLVLLGYTEYVRRKSVAWYGFALVAYACSLMSKQMLVTLPFLLLLLDYWPLERIRAGVWRRLLLEKIPFLALAIVSSVVVLLAQSRGGSLSDLEQHSLGLRCANSVVAYLLYLGQTFWPRGLACFYPYPVSGYSVWLVAVAMLVLLSITTMVVRFARRRPYLPVGWFWFVGSLVPVIGLVQVGSQAMADRYTYWSLTGLFVALVWLVHSLATDTERSGSWLAVPATVLILTLAVASWVQTSSWRDTFSVWSHAIAVTEGNYRAHNNLGAALGPLGRYDEAAGHFHLALEAYPDYASAHGNLGKVLDLQGQFAEAERHFRRAVELDPSLLSARINWAMGLSVRGRYQEAIDRYRQALEIDPGNEVVLRLMTQTEEALGNGEQ